MNRVLFKIGSLNIYWYSVLILLAVIIGIFLARRESKKVGMSLYIENILFEIILYGIIGARLYYVIFNFQEYKNNLLAIFKVWEGGLAIYGAVIGGLIAILHNAKKNKENILKTTDIVVPSLILGQAIGRWGNFFNGEAHGGETTLAFLKNIHIPQFIINGMYIEGHYYHPTFLYESLWCLIGFVILLIIRSLTKRKKGIVTFIYFIWYGLGRYIIEGLRTDSLYIGKMKVSQIVSIILVITGVIGLIISIIKKNKEKAS